MEAIEDQGTPDLFKRQKKILRKLEKNTSEDFVQIFTHTLI